VTNLHAASWKTRQRLEIAEDGLLQKWRDDDPMALRTFNEIVGLNVITPRSKTKGRRFLDRNEISTIVKNLVTTGEVIKRFKNRKDVKYELSGNPFRFSLGTFLKWARRAIIDPTLSPEERTVLFESLLQKIADDKIYYWTVWRKSASPRTRGLRDEEWLTREQLESRFLNAAFDQYPYEMEAAYRTVCRLKPIRKSRRVRHS
jgi:hypothetical protein